MDEVGCCERFASNQAAYRHYVADHGALLYSRTEAQSRCDGCRMGLTTNGVVQMHSETGCAQLETEHVTCPVPFCQLVLTSCELLKSHVISNHGITLDELAKFEARQLSGDSFCFNVISRLYRTIISGIRHNSNLPTSDASTKERSEVWLHFLVLVQNITDATGLDIVLDTPGYGFQVLNTGSVERISNDLLVKRVHDFLTNARGAVSLAKRRERPVKRGKGIITTVGLDSLLHSIPLRGDPVVDIDSLFILIRRMPPSSHHHYRDHHRAAVAKILTRLIRLCHRVVQSRHSDQS